MKKILHSVLALAALVVLSAELPAHAAKRGSRERPPASAAIDRGSAPSRTVGSGIDRGDCPDGLRSYTDSSSGDHSGGFDSGYDSNGYNSRGESF